MRLTCAPNLIFILSLFNLDELKSSSILQNECLVGIKCHICWVVCRFCVKVLLSWVFLQQGVAGNTNGAPEQREDREIVFQNGDDQLFPPGSHFSTASYVLTSCFLCVFDPVVPRAYTEGFLLLPLLFQKVFAPKIYLFFPHSISTDTFVTQTSSSTMLSALNHSETH